MNQFTQKTSSSRVFILKESHNLELESTLNNYKQAIVE